jgi:hypothetical protein
VDLESNPDVWRAGWKYINAYQFRWARAHLPVRRVSRSPRRRRTRTSRPRPTARAGDSPAAPSDPRSSQLAPVRER